MMLFFLWIFCHTLIHLSVDAAITEGPVSKCPNKCPPITEGPVSRIALVGQTIQFHCAGTGNDLAWKVDGFIGNNPTVLARGISAATRISSGTAQSNLTVPATSGNNGTTVQCIVGSTSGFVSSNYSTLSVLQGIGRVRNLQLKFFRIVKWDPPSTVINYLISDISYHFTVTNMNTGVMIINTTTTSTSHPIDLQNCNSYIVRVAAVSQDYKGDAAVIMVRTQRGGYYQFNNNASEEVICGPSPVVVVFTLNLQVSGGSPCPNQNLRAKTYPQTDPADIELHPEINLDGNDVKYNVANGIVRKRIFIAEFTISSYGRDNQSYSLNFSTFDVQHCDVRTDRTSLLVECTFAINSTAPGFVLIQDEHSQYTTSTTLQRHEGDDHRGSANIVDLPTGEYRVSVYDQIEEYQNGNGPAYVHPQPIQITPYWLPVIILGSCCLVFIIILSALLIVVAVVKQQRKKK